MRHKSNQGSAAPYENIVYIGDSATDIPCMRLVKSRGGYSIGVFDPQKDTRKKVYQLYSDGRINFYAPADYSARSDISRYMKQIIDEISAREQLKTEQKILQINPDIYKLYTAMNDSIDRVNGTGSVSAKELKKFQASVEEIRRFIDGDID